MKIFNMTVLYDRPFLTFSKHGLPFQDSYRIDQLTKVPRYNHQLNQN